MSLELKKISKKFFRTNGDSNFFYALNNINFSCEEGKFIEIIGKSGSGKSTLLNILSGLLTPDEGEVRVDNTELFSLDDKERSRFRNENFGIVMQGQTGLQSLTVLENILIPTLLYPNEDKTDLALDLIKRLDIESLKDSYPNELSGGELRRMAIARALIMNPKVIFADEPTGDLDSENTKIVLDILSEIKNEGKIVIMVTHDRDALNYADVIYKMEKGELSLYQNEENN